MKSELSKKNLYFVEKNRMNELRYFCMQYPIWKAALNGIKSHLLFSKDILVNISQKTDVSDLTFKAAEQMIFYENLIKLIEDAAEKTSNVFQSQLIFGITNNKSYDVIKTKMEIPCCRNYYYTLYRKFFYTLSKMRYDKFQC